MKAVSKYNLVLLALMVAVSITGVAISSSKDTPRASQVPGEKAAPGPSTILCCCWNVDTYNCDNLEPGTANNHAWWCGDYLPSCGGDDPVGGYGNNWDCKLDRYITVPDIAVPITINIEAMLNYNMEAGYDYLTLEYVDLAGTATILTSYTGVASGVLVSESFTVTPPDYGGPNLDQVHVRWHFTSDVAFSDEDCSYPSNGAVQLDAIVVTYDQGMGPVLESEEYNEGPNNMWFDPECEHEPEIQGFKWGDLDCDGIWDADESGLPDWEIQLYQGMTLLKSTTTDANGEYAFCNVPPGTYRVAENLSPGMIQTYPPTVKYNFDYDGATHLADLNFGNTVCAHSTICTDTLLAGRVDDFDDSDGSEPTTVSPELDQFISNCSWGGLYEFDVVPINKCFGYTFSEDNSPCWQYARNGCISGAWLITRLKASDGNTLNDGLAIREDGVSVWNIGLDELQGLSTGGFDTDWSSGDTNTFVLDLANLPIFVHGTNNVLATLQDGDLDFTITDDTGVDYVKLVIEVCTEIEEGSIHGTKFHDIDCDGVHDYDEPGLEGWEIRLYAGASLLLTTLTDAQGDYSFTGVAPGSYRVVEIVGSEYLQTWPHTVSYAVELTATGGLQDLDFGNRRCDIGISCVDTCFGGRIDDFATSDGPEPTTVSPELDMVISNCSAGPLYNFDDVRVDRCFGYTFYDTCSTCWQSTECVVGASLTIRMESAEAYHNNDGFNLREDGEVVWSIPMNTLQSIFTGGSDPLWSTGDVNTFELDLADLPAAWRGVTNVLATLQDGDLDVMVSDDTGVDYVMLVVEKCAIPVSGAEQPVPHLNGLRATIRPNPFNPMTLVEFEIPAPAWTNLSVYDLQGRRVNTLFNEFMPASSRTVRWDGRDSRGRMQAAGVYFFRLESGKLGLTKKAVLLK